MLYLKKDPNTAIPKMPTEWKATTVATEAKLSAALTSAVSKRNYANGCGNISGIW